MAFTHTVRLAAPLGLWALSRRTLALQTVLTHTARRPPHPGFEKPSAIQQRGIVPFCRGYDVIQQAQSGTGKTATFCAGVLQQVRPPCRLPPPPG